MRVILVVAVLLWGGAVGARADSLFETLGGRDKIAAITADLVGRMTTDPRIAHFFKETDRDRLTQRLTDQFCHLAGEKRRYRGANMRNAHDGLGIHTDDFNALVEDLQLAMDDQQIPFLTQNRLLALLAPLKHDVVGD